MFVVFEGIDGSGKTTLSNQVAARLRASGLMVEHVRADGKFASSVAEAIRTLCRDARNLQLHPKAEFLLYLARELQTAEEILKPALARHDVVLADRFFSTAEVLAGAGRHLPSAWTTPVLQTVTSEVVPDMLVLVDVDPTLARARRKAHKLAVADLRPPSRRGLAGVGLQHRLRAGYLALARDAPERWAIVDNDSDLAETVSRVSDLIEHALRAGVQTSLERFRKRVTNSHAPKRRTPGPRSMAEALTAFVAWLDQRASEPRVAAYMLSGLCGPGVDALRESLAPRVPEAVLAGLIGLVDGVSWQIRQRLKADHPGWVARSLLGVSNRDEHASALRAELMSTIPEQVLTSLAAQDDEWAWSMRQQWFDAQPHAVMRSLRGLGAERAWELRERWLHANAAQLGSEYECARVAAATISGLADERAWRVRDAIWPAAPVAALGSIAGLTCTRSWQLREQHLSRAPKAVMASLRSMRDEQAWSMRRTVAADCKEALDSIPELDEPAAWELRYHYADVWPSTAVKTLGCLAGTLRGQAFVERQLRAHPRNISLLKHAAGLALGVHQVAPTNLEPEPT
jgi:dTMP kinase